MSCVVVLGLPRSGTSAVAGILHEILKVPMGKMLMPPLAGVNDKGFFEDEEFVAAHIEIMRAHEDPQILFDIPTPPDDAILDRYAALIRSRDANNQLWGVKDPKMCFVLPYFLNRLPEAHQTKIIVTRRPFHESVASMKPTYGGMTLERAAILQGRYLYSMEKNLADFHGETLTVDFKRLIAFPGFLLTEIGHFLDVKVTGEMHHQVAQFVDPKLKHH